MPLLTFTKKHYFLKVTITFTLIGKNPIMLNLTKNKTI